MKSFANKSDIEEALTRLARVTPESQRRWGKMTPHQMICHLHDSFRSVIGEREVLGDKSNLATRTVVRWLALYAPLKWPHGVRTMPENDQEQGGTPPEDFQRDLHALAATIERVTSAQRDFEWGPSSAVCGDERARLDALGISARRSSFAAIWIVSEAWLIQES